MKSINSWNRRRHAGRRRLATLCAMLLATLASCSRPPAPIVAPDAERDDLEVVVDRLRNVLGESTPATSIPNVTVVPTTRIVKEYDMQPAADGRPAAATITIRTIPGRAALAEKRGDVDNPAESVEDSSTDETYQLAYGEKGWELVEQPQTEVEKLWFVYALPD